MRIQSFQDLEKQYKPEYNNEISDYELEERAKFLKNNYSVIVEGDLLEFATLDKWIKKNNIVGVENYFYGKTGYDFGFKEYYVSNKDHYEKLIEIIPLLFTVYPNAVPKSLIYRSVGYQEQIEYNNSIKNAIILP